jgi:serine/threonine protein kinase
MIVLQFAEHRSLRNYLDQNYSKLSWERKIYQLYCIANGLDQIHKKELIHRNLHIGNILKLKYETSITDIGLCKPANYDEMENENNNNIYGVLPYIAPEILRGKNYTKAADIYSFGIIMYEVISGLPPHYDVSHDESLAIKICQGFRPRFNIKVPELIVHLIKQCLDATPSNRPTADKLWSILLQWYNDNNVELCKQIKEISNIPSLSLSYKLHSEAIYVSRLLSFNNLPEPKNSDNYYEQNNNKINMEMKHNDDIVIQVYICI